MRLGALRLHPEQPEVAGSGAGAAGVWERDLRGCADE